MLRLAAPLAALALALVSCGTSAPKRRTLPIAPRVTPEPPPPVAEPAPPPVVQPRPEVLVARARVLRAEGDAEGARERLEAAHEAAPDDEETRIELADLLVADGRDLERAESLLSGVASPQAPRLHLVRARLAEARKDDALAAEQYAAALAEEDDPDARFRRALALERLGRFGEATVELEAVRAARPDDAVARARLADRYEAAGRIAEAEAEHRFLVDADPERAASWKRLARFYERIGRPKDARAAAGRASASSRRPERSLRPLLPSAR